MNVYLVMSTTKCIVCNGNVNYKLLATLNLPTYPIIYNIIYLSKDKIVRHVRQRTLQKGKSLYKIQLYLVYSHYLLIRIRI